MNKVLNISFNSGAVEKELAKNQRKALFYAMEKARQRLHALGKIPYDTGNLQTETFVDASSASDGEFRLVSGPEYAAVLYFRPELRFKTHNNANAGAYWFEGFISGGDSGFIEAEYARKLAELNKG